MTITLHLMQLAGESPGQNIELLFCNWQQDDGLHRGICFVPTDLAAVIQVRHYIEGIADEFSLSEQSRFELALVADELVANAILASYAKAGPENVILKWSMKDYVFTLSVLDYGGGFRLKDVFSELPAGENLADFLRSLEQYRESHKAVVPLNGKLIEHVRFGRGLQIISHLVRKIEVIYHEPNGERGTEPTAQTVGSIVTVEYVAGAA
ncbi:MAG: ATP-binding protein [Turneriella sp.]|nr:ATP-binding protein [Turneriella sp.]